MPTRHLALRYHPDRGAGCSTEKFRQIAQAYETLIDPGRTQGYDLSLLPARRPELIRVEPTTASGGPLYHEHPQRMIGRKPLLRRDVTEHRTLLAIFSSHKLKT